MSQTPRIEPKQLMLIKEPFSHPDWPFEIKHDGCSALAYVFDGNRYLVSRRRNSYKSFAELKEEIARTLKVKNTVLDGEIVVLDQEGLRWRRKGENPANDGDGSQDTCRFSVSVGVAPSELARWCSFGHPTLA
jgi:hypothetical protein